MIEIANELRRCWERKEAAVLAAVIGVNGSVYRKEGARCLIRQDGSITGIVSGGCVEKDLAEYAREVLGSGKPMQVDYDFRTDEDAMWGLGVGCNGALTIWLQPFDPVGQPELARGMLEAFELRASSPVPFVSGTVIRSGDERRLPVGRMIRMGQEADISAPRGAVRTCEIDGVVAEVFVEAVRPRPRLAIFGAGEDAKPLARAARFLGWHVTIVDHRERLLDRRIFPEADEFVAASRDGYSSVVLPKSAAAVIMTHNYEIDRSTLGQLLQQELAYLGQLGPRQRLDRMLADLQSAGHSFDARSFDKLHSPIGLDIGAETPEEIALCIVAEICAKLNRASGVPLRDKPAKSKAG